MSIFSRVIPGMLAMARNLQAGKPAGPLTVAPKSNKSILGMVRTALTQATSSPQQAATRSPNSILPSSGSGVLGGGSSSVIPGAIIPPKKRKKGPNLSV